MKRLWPLIVAASLACGSGSRQQFQLQIASPNSSMVDGDSTKLRMQAGEKLIVALVVVGHAPGQVRYSSQNLPAFGTLDGSLLTLSPARSQAGEYSFTLTATAGSDSQSATLSVSVGRYNSAPTWRPYANWEDEYGDRHFICPSGPICTAGRNPRLGFLVCDAEGDEVKVDVEVVPRGIPFTKVPTHSGASSGGFPAYDDRGSPTTCYNVRVSLSGLAPEHSYDFGARASDEFGAVARVTGSTDGWAYQPGWWGFDQGPCTPGKCACVPSGTSLCNLDSDCCSGVCNPMPSGNPLLRRCR